MRGDIGLPAKRILKEGKLFKILSIVLAMLFFACMGVAYAYFTATADATGELEFAEVEIAMKNGSSTYSQSVLETKLEGLEPGDEISLDDVKIENTGSVDIYVLLHLYMQVVPTDNNYATLEYDSWYNLEGDEVDLNFDINTASATLLSANASQTSVATYNVPTSIGMDYRNATANVTLTACAIQASLRDADAYVTKGEYASYMIVDLCGGTYTGEPLRKVSATVYDTRSYDSSTSTWTVTRNVGKISFDGTEGWGVDSTNNFYTTNAISDAYASQVVYCTHYDSTQTSLKSSGNNAYISSTSQLCIQDNTVTHTASAWQTLLASYDTLNDPLTVWYRLATLTSTTYTV